MPGRAHEGEGGIALRGQLGGVDGTGCSKVLGIAKAIGLDEFDVFKAVNFADVLQAGRQHLHELISLPLIAPGQ